ncbi:MAG: hypothetical protein AB9888_13100 [Bacteroidales bacterium]
MSKNIGLDMGFGAFKMSSDIGGKTQTLSQVATNGTQAIATMAGLKKAIRSAVKITTKDGAFWVGSGAHDLGRAIEDLGYDRFVSPEITAILYAAMSEHIPTLNDKTSEQINLMVGLPVEILKRNDTSLADIRRWMEREHTWECDGKVKTMKIEKAIFTSQATGALFNRVITIDPTTGLAITDPKYLKKGEEFGVLSVGFNTLELMVIRDKALVEVFTASFTSGVRRMLELANVDHSFTLGELDIRLRNNVQDFFPYITIWQREVFANIEACWSTKWKRFATVLVCGGGSLLLQKELTTYFGGKSYLDPKDAVMAIANGLYKLAVFQGQQKK